MVTDQYNMERRRVFRVLISVSDKENIVNFATALDNLDIEIVSTGGTYQTISKKGIDVTPVEKVTNFPEMMGGRLKTLHPLIFGGILARDSDSKDAEKHNIDFFDIVVCNLYPFREAISKRVDTESLIEQIDIGGPSLLRAAAKNYARVAVVSDPADYDWIINEIKAGGLTLLQRQASKSKSSKSSTVSTFISTPKITNIPITIPLRAATPDTRASMNLVSSN